MGRTWRLGTRGSALATTQSGMVAAQITALTGDPVELVIIRTKGDAVTDRPLGQVGGKGLFTKEIEDALLAGDVDLAVHSLKDLPSEGPPGLVLGAIPEREDPRDVLVGPPLAALRNGAVVGTGSLRRRLQLLAVRPDVQLAELRGNVDTRVGKVRSGALDAIVLAAAGLRRLGRAADIAEALPVEVMVPAVGQGALAVQCRADDAAMLAVLGRLDHADTRLATDAERVFLETIAGGCSVPAACHAVVQGEHVRLLAFYGAADGRSARAERVVPRAAANATAAVLATALKAQVG